MLPHRQPEKKDRSCPTPLEAAACAFGSNPGIEGRARRCWRSREGDPVVPHALRAGPNKSHRASGHREIRAPALQLHECTERALNPERGSSAVYPVSPDLALANTL